MMSIFRRSNTIIREVNNRELVLGLDYLYRKAMKVFEVEKLLPLSKRLLKVLNAPKLEVPIEGYYGESEGLKEYFITMRSLQDLSKEDSLKVESSDDYKTLYTVSTSPIFGQKDEGKKFFPKMRDSLYFALDSTLPNECSEEVIVEKAFQFSKKLDDYSLVGLAALCKDAIVMTAIRESVVLYATDVAPLSALRPPKYEYQWKVDKEVEKQANRFISEFNKLTSSKILKAKARNAEYFYDASKDNDISGRCVRIAYDDSQIPTQNYHWAINNKMGRIMFDEFWDTELWTTDMYKRKR